MTLENAKPQAGIKNTSYLLGIAVSLTALIIVVSISIIWQGQKELKSRVRDDASDDRNGMQVLYKTHVIQTSKFFEIILSQTCSNLSALELDGRPVASDLVTFAMDRKTVKIQLPNQLALGYHDISFYVTQDKDSISSSHRLPFYIVPAELSQPQLTIRDIKKGETQLVTITATGVLGADLEIYQKIDGQTLQKISTVSLAKSLAVEIDIPVDNDNIYNIYAKQKYSAALDNQPRTIESALSNQPLLKLGPKTTYTIGSLETNLTVHSSSFDLDWNVVFSKQALPKQFERLGVAIAVDHKRFLACGPRDELFTEDLGDYRRYSGKCSKFMRKDLLSSLFVSGARLSVFLIDQENSQWSAQDLSLPQALRIPLLSKSLIITTDPDVHIVDYSKDPSTVSLAPNKRVWQLSENDHIFYIRFQRNALLPLMAIPDPIAAYRSPYNMIVESAEQILEFVLIFFPLVLTAFTLRLSREKTGALMFFCLGVGQSLYLSNWYIRSIFITRNFNIQSGLSIAWLLVAGFWSIFLVFRYEILQRLKNTVLALVLTSASSHLWTNYVDFHLIRFYNHHYWLVTFIWLLFYSLILLVFFCAFLRKAFAYNKIRLLFFFGACIITGMLEYYSDPSRVRIVHNISYWFPLVIVVLVISNEESIKLASIEIIALIALICTFPTERLTNGMPLGFLLTLAVWLFWKPLLRTSECERGTSSSYSAIDECEAVLFNIGQHPLARTTQERQELDRLAKSGKISRDAYVLACERIEEESKGQKNSTTQAMHRDIPDILSIGTSEGSITDGLRSLCTGIPIIAIFLLLAFFSKNPFSSSTELVHFFLEVFKSSIKTAALCFFFGLLFKSIPGSAGIIKALVISLVFVAIEFSIGTVEWTRIEDFGNSLASICRVFLATAWVGLIAFDYKRIRLIKKTAYEAIHALIQLHGYRQALAIITSVVLALATAILSGATGKIANAVVNLPHYSIQSNVSVNPK